MKQELSNPYQSAATRRYALVLLTVVYAFNFIDRQLLAILQESIKADLGLSDGQLGLLAGFAFAIFYVTAGIPIARWADRSNRRNIVAGAVFLWSFMTAVSGFAQNYVQLLLARIGVGVGEAGGSPPSHSIISDIFPPEKRASAMGFYSTGVNIGILFGFLLGGWLNEFFGWRVAFIVVGIPGIFIALLVRATLAEPMRGLSENKHTAPAEPSPSLGQTLNILWSRRSFRHMSFAAALNAFCGYSTASWTASFMIRSHSMSTGELGTWLAMISGVGGAIGVIAGGILADKLALRDKRWYVWVPAVAGVISVPFMAAVYIADTAYMALILSIIPGLLHNVYLGSTIATTHGLVGLRMRALASAILFLILNIIGLGLGPLLVGMLSDLLQASEGAHSLRQAMLYLLPPIMVWSTVHFLLAARSLRADLERAPA
ncbi:spinster family MFS transporter [Candidatus Marimicrobium litorale]|uniref:MFS transporter n=1 Tax=Candidatus Marimicrobium litorale TaxID=2518991 RepID=A0ABT3T2Y2_9GAMM|nr:MFS transporter [Candidatus Marimicrobium litorale]MCX2976615.1 MFS transporter [Candidatus Marimicrobium litorale]